MINISAIIPSYNSLKLLKRCLDSIKGQVELGDKVIIVDDGSTDGTLEYLLNTYSNDDNYLILHQPNSGSGPARNKGLINVNTQYIWFIDADDFIEKGSFSEIKKELTSHEYDIMFIGYKKMLNDEIIEQSINYNPHEVNQLYLTNHFPWNKIIKASLFKNVHFPTEKIRYQDHATIPRILVKAEKIGLFKKNLYYYDFGHEGNISKDNKKINDQYIACNYLIDNLKENHNKELEVLLIKSFVFDMLYKDRNFSNKYVELSNIKKLLNAQVPGWKTNECLNYSFGRKNPGLIPGLKQKIMIGRIFKRSTLITFFILYPIIKAKPLLKKYLSI